MYLDSLKYLENYSDEKNDGFTIIHDPEISMGFWGTKGEGIMVADETPEEAKTLLNIEEND